MKKTFLILLIISSFVFYFANLSCNRTNFGTEISIVDSLSAEANKFLTQLNALDSSEVMLLAPIISEDLEWTKDSLTKEDLKNSSIFLSKLKTGKKLVARFPYEYSRLKLELQKSLDQLSDLKSDLSNSSIEREEATKYINDEKSALQIIVKQQNGLFGQFNALNDYKEVRTAFYQMVHSNVK